MDKTIKLLDLKEGSIIQNLNGHKDTVIVIQKFIHPKYGECLLSQGYGKDQIILWN